MKKSSPSRAHQALRPRPATVAEPGAGESAAAFGDRRDPTPPRDDERSSDDTPRSRGRAPERARKIAEVSKTRQGAAYEGAMEAVFAIPIGVGLGYWADSAFDTSPWCLLVGAVFGFAAFVVRLFRMNALVQETAEATETPPQRSVASQPTDTNGILRAADRRPSGESGGGDEAGEPDTEDR